MNKNSPGRRLLPVRPSERKRPLAKEPFSKQSDGISESTANLLNQHNTPGHGPCTEPFAIASTKLTTSVRQAPAILEFRIYDANDSSLPVPPGARLSERPAAQGELAKKTSQLELTFEARGLIDPNSIIGQAARARIVCYHCGQLIADCRCEKPAVDNGMDNTAAEESEKPFDRARRLQREF
jgi:hypothetical protein